MARSPGGVFNPSRVATSTQIKAQPAVNLIHRLLRRKLGQFFPNVTKGRIQVIWKIVEIQLGGSGISHGFDVDKVTGPPTKLKLCATALTSNRVIETGIFIFHSLILAKGIVVRPRLCWHFLAKFEVHPCFYNSDRILPPQDGTQKGGCRQVYQALRKLAIDFPGSRSKLKSRRMGNLRG